MNMSINPFLAFGTLILLMGSACAKKPSIIKIKDPESNTFESHIKPPKRLTVPNGDTPEQPHNACEEKDWLSLHTISITFFNRWALTDTSPYETWHKDYQTQYGYAVYRQQTLVPVREVSILTSNPVIEEYYKEYIANPSENYKVISWLWGGSFALFTGSISLLFFEPKE